MVAPAYTVEILDLLGNVKIADAECERLDYSKALEGTGTASFDLPMDMAGVTRDNLEPDQSEVRIYRGGTRVWGGYHWFSGIDWDTGTVTFDCENYISRLEHHYVLDDLFFNDVDQYAIVRNLIDYVQTGDIPGSLDTARIFWDYGFTVQAGSSGTTRTRNWCCPPTDSIADIIRDLAHHHDGFDYEITPNKLLSMWTPRRGSDLALEFRYNVEPDETSNVWAINNNEIDGRDRRTLIVALPHDTGCWECDDMLLVEPLTGADAQASGVLMEVMDLSHIKHKGSREKRAREKLRIRKHNRQQMTITTPVMPFGNYEVGDAPLMWATRGYIQYDGERFRILDWHVFVDGGNEQADVTLDWPKEELSG